MGTIAHTETILNSSLPISTKQRMLEKKTYKYSTNKEDYRLEDKLRIADDYINRLWLNKQQKEEIYYMIKVECPDLKKVCGKNNLEQIIALIVFNTIKNKCSYAKLENYKLFKELELGDRDYANFIHNLYNNMRKKSYLI